MFNPARKLPISCIMIEKTGSSLQIALNGLLRSQERFAESATRVASGDIDADAIIQTKIDELDVKTQLSLFKRVSDLEDKLLDIIA